MTKMRAEGSASLGSKDGGCSQVFLTRLAGWTSLRGWQASKPGSGFQSPCQCWMPWPGQSALKGVGCAVTVARSVDLSVSHL